MDRVIVGLSGGVDSAVTAALLLQRGFAVHGITLKTWKIHNASHNDTNSAAEVARVLGIPLEERDISVQFYNEIVVKSFVDQYASGITPNPCVVCNPTLKFQTLLNTADALNCTWIATGHYARVIHLQNRSKLLRGTAPKKDQSYALYRLEQKHLQRMLLPLGELPDKATVRQLARQLGLPNANQADSQDLCFMGGGDYRELLNLFEHAHNKPGAILDEQGNVIGQHTGLANFTVGQRSGIGIASQERLYVLRLDPNNNTLTVGRRSSLYQSSCLLDAVSFTSGSPPADQFSSMAQIRYRSIEAAVKVVMSGLLKAKIHFAKPQAMITPGQSLVFYDGDEVLGGGIISTNDNAGQS
ncbi:MAG: tRNA 2-thiouridine(34) synthase MnmA [Anaerolineae bacterium]|nr:tRNA 2-thiouridine(34) synthase MnmA [Anaerolineae bacterium]